VRIERLVSPGSEWDAFVEAQPGATLAHAAVWASVLRRAYRLHPVYLVARAAGGAIRGVLPLVRFRTLRGRRELVSLPFHDTGGVLADAPEAARALLEAALDLAREAEASALELRQREPLLDLPSAPLDRVDLVLDLEPDEEAQWQALPAKVRNQTRKATREGLRLLPGGAELAPAFFAPFASNMRDLGSPVHGLAFFAAMAEAFGSRLRFFVAGDGARPVGGLVAIHFAGTVTVPWASTLRAERSRCPNNLIYWEAIRWSVSLRAREFDFGRSPIEAGTYRFKKGWGARERPLAWLRLDRDGSPLPIESVSEEPVLRRLSELWQRLPVEVTRWLGPRIRRHLAN
jgi:FemAB-related protein (PEP-CTERM system-associated)